MKTEDTMSNCLQINNISKTYKRGKVRANRAISTILYPGQIVSLIGHNGAGKTTLLNQIIGVTKPDNGDVIYQGKSLVQNTEMARNLVSMMPQFHAPLSGVKLRQAIDSIIRIRGNTGVFARKETNKILDALDIRKWENQSGEKLSGGLQRLTSFAMAVASPPPIILLDEPTNDVDPVRRRYIWQYLRQLAEKGHIVAIVTHNLLEVEQYSDRYLLFNHGEIIQDNSPKILDKNISTNTLTIEIKNDEILDAIPLEIRYKYFEEEMNVVMTLSVNEISPVMDWVVKMIHDEQIINYRLSSSSLEATYGGMTNV